jgi:phosphoribosylformimino-5-aminoimidazole carboxamide ribotide isomerase
MAFQYPQRIILGLDARNGMVATHGWLTTSETSALDVAREFAQWPLYAIVYTDIAKDGMMAGPNVGAMVELAAAVPLPVIASGGVTTIDDVRQLKQHHIFGAIIGRSLYEGQIDLAAAIELVESPAPGTTTSAEKTNG